MLAFTLLVLPLLMAVSAVILMERVTHNMGWQKGKNVFDGVSVTVETLVGLGRMSETAGQHVLKTLINELLEAGWDTADEALRDHLDNPFIVQAFKDCGVEVHA